MTYRWLADATVVLHFAFIAFVVLGSVLVRRRRAWAWLHVPAVVWVAYLEFTGTVCPLTPLENALRARAGDAGYAGGFVEHYLVPIIYPAGLTPGIQIALGAAVIAVNLLAYWSIWRRRRAPAMVENR
jgi:Protein of Unknown function (DUF2784)